MEKTFNFFQTIASSRACFSDDEQDTLALNLISNKFSWTPLLWKTVEHKRLKNNRARYEDQMLSKLKEAMPKDVIVTLDADRGFSDKKCFKFIEEELGFNDMIRFKKGTYISNVRVKKKSSLSLFAPIPLTLTAPDLCYFKPDYPKSNHKKPH